MLFAFVALVRLLQYQLSFLCFINSFLNICFLLYFLLVTLQTIFILFFSLSFFHNGMG